MALLLYNFTLSFAEDYKLEVESVVTLRPKHDIKCFIAKRVHD